MTTTSTTPGCRADREQARRLVRGEAPYFASFLGRCLRAMVRHAQAGDLEAVAELAALRDYLPEITTDAIRAAHAAGYSYAQIGHAIGVTRQAVRQAATA